MQREEENTSLLHWHTDMEKWMALIQTKDYITQFYWISHCSFDYNSIDECVRVWVCFCWIYRQCTRDDDCIQNNQPYYFHHFIHIAPFYTLSLAQMLISNSLHTLEQDTNPEFYSITLYLLFHCLLFGH